MYDVALPSDAPFTVLTDDELAHFEYLVTGYQEGFALQHPSDVSDLDRIVILELLVYRWGRWQADGKDYDGNTVDVLTLQKQTKDYSTEIRQLKKGLGVDAISRQKASGKGSVAHYIEALLARAGAFGYLRNQQHAKALELINDIISLAEMSRNCLPDEQRRFGVTPEGIIDFILDVARSEYQAIDQHFQETQAQYWVRDQ